MNEAILSQKEIEEIKKVPGEVMGVSLKEDFDFVFKKEGQEGIERIEEELKKLGFPLRYREIKNFRWYSLVPNLFILALAKSLFNWSDEMFRELGRTNAKVGVIMKFMMTYFVSTRRVLSETERYWGKYYTRGELKVERLDEKQRLIEVALKDFPGHSTLCRLLEGYFWQILSYLVPKESLKVWESECVFKGGKVHRFRANW